MGTAPGSRVEAELSLSSAGLVLSRAGLLCPCTYRICAEAPGTRRRESQRESVVAFLVSQWKGSVLSVRCVCESKLLRKPVELTFLNVLSKLGQI